jgi:hypothetical protein
MEVSMEQQQLADAALEILKDRFGALEAVANSSIKLARYAPEDELAMDLLVAESVLESAAACARRGMGRWSELSCWGWCRLREELHGSRRTFCGCRDFPAT